VRLRRGDHALDLRHHRFVDVEPPRGVHDDGVAPLARGARGDRRGVLGDPRGVDRLHRNAELLSQRDELIDRSRPVHVRRDEERAASLLAQEVRELCRGRRLPGPLQAREHDDRGRSLGAHERRGLAAEHLDERVVDDLHDLLRAGDRLEHLRAERALPDRRDELTDDLEVHVRFEQRDADVAERLLEIRLRDARAPAEALERDGQLVGELLEHPYRRRRAIARRGPCPCPATPLSTSASPTSVRAVSGHASFCRERSVRSSPGATSGP